MDSVVMWSWILMTLFIILMLALGVVGMKRTHNSDDFATARSSYGPITIALVIAAGISSGSTFMGMPGLAYAVGAPSLWYPLLYPVATVFGMLFFAKAIKEYGDRLGTRTIPEFIGNRYNSSFLRVVLALISILLIFYVISQLVAAATMFQIMMGINYNTGIIITVVVIGIYVFMGGSHSDILTDAIQGLLMVLVAIIVVVCFSLGVGVEGGFGELINRINERRPDGTFDKLFLSNDPTYGNMWLVLLLLIAHIPFAVQPHLGNKFMAVKSTKDLKNLLMFTTVFATILPLMGLGGMLAIGVLDPNSEIRPDAVIPTLFTEIFPPVVAAFLAVAVLSAVMSTSDGLVVSLTQILANDLFRLSIVPKMNISEEKAEKYEMQISRYSTFLFLILAGIVAWNPPEFLSIFMWIGIGGIVSATAGPLVVGSLWKRANRISAIISLVMGTISYWFIYLPFGLNVSNPFAAAGYGVIISMITMVIATLVTSKPTDNNLLLFDEIVEEM
ncbi:sodium:solute symporter family protein [Macrococcus animalis]|uniref:sodium:solute symporter family protein n=1 Tax=Macrococcus animalis TaxID=3395467 RepID=UPI0039BDC618